MSTRRMLPDSWAVLFCWCRRVHDRCTVEGLYRACTNTQRCCIKVDKGLHKPRGQCKYRLLDQRAPARRCRPHPSCIITESLSNRAAVVLLVFPSFDLTLSSSFAYQLILKYQKSGLDHGREVRWNRAIYEICAKTDFPSARPRISATSRRSQSRSCQR